jgi:hypothetical protein
MRQLRAGRRRPHTRYLAVLLASSGCAHAAPQAPRASPPISTASRIFRSSCSSGTRKWPHGGTSQAMGGLTGGASVGPAGYDPGPTLLLMERRLFLSELRPDATGLPGISPRARGRRDDLGTHHVNCGLVDKGAVP